MDGSISQFAGIYSERAPNALLREHLRCIWVNDLSQSRSEWVRVVPDGCVDILWTGTDLVVAGPDTQCILDRLPRGTVVVGVRFHPGAASSWLGLPVSQLLNTRVPLTELWRSDADRLFDYVNRNRSTQGIGIALETFMQSRLAQVGHADKQIAFLRRAAGDNCQPANLRLDRLAADVGMSERTLRRRCLGAFGYGFKTLNRVLRFQRFLLLVTQSPTSSLADLAVRVGYADQAHMTRDVQRLSGLSPSQFFAEHRGNLADLFNTRPAADYSIKG